jgi:DNA-binding PadR family transcriptional regulator
MRSVAVLSDLELTLLGLVRDEPRSGYDLRKHLDASPGAVYPALKRLSAAGLLDAKAEAGGRKKETFHITAAGRKALKSGLHKPTLDEVRRDPQAVAERMRFLSGAALKSFLAEYARLSLACAARLKGRKDLLSQHDAAVYAARARWASRKRA